jgi:hypothetical protein
MGYSYIEGKKFLGPGPNISGAGFLIDAIEKAGKDVYPNLYELISTGESPKPTLVKSEADKLLKATKASNVRDMLQKLSEAASKASKVITVSH